MKTLLIVHHSRTGGVAQMADAAALGARSASGVQVVPREAGEASAEDLLGADGYMFCAPENLAALSGAMKEFFDRTYYLALDRIGARPYAALICAGSDGQNALRQLRRIATGWRLREVAEPIVVVTGAQTPEAIRAAKTISEADLQRCEELGQAMAEGLALGVF
jgi:multimeric flavodoxin WrbA